MCALKSHSTPPHAPAQFKTALLPSHGEFKRMAGAAYCFCKRWVWRWKVHIKWNPEPPQTDNGLHMNISSALPAGSRSRAVGKMKAVIVSVWRETGKPLLDECLTSVQINHIKSTGLLHHGVNVTMWSIFRRKKIDQEWILWCKPGTFPFFFFFIFIF